MKNDEIMGNNQKQRQRVKYFVKYQNNINFMIYSKNNTYSCDSSSDERIERNTQNITIRTKL